MKTILLKKKKKRRTTGTNILESFVVGLGVDGGPVLTVLGASKFPLFREASTTTCTHCSKAININLNASKNAAQQKKKKRKKITSYREWELQCKPKVDLCSCNVATTHTASIDGSRFPCR